MNSFIEKDFKSGNNLFLGHGVIIESDVVVGSNVKIGHRVTLKSGTRIGSNSTIDDHCITTGACFIGNNVNIRTGAIISRATIIEDMCFIGPGVITNHTKHVTHGREGKVQKEELITYIGFGCIVGSQASLLAGLNIEPQVIIGGGSVVIGNLKQKSVYVGTPCRRIGDLPEEYLMKEPLNSGKMYLTTDVIEHFKKYMPFLNLENTGHSE